MKTIITYPLPFDNWELFKPMVERFTSAFKKFPPGIDYEVWAMCCWGEPKAHDCCWGEPDGWTRDQFHGINTRFVNYHGNGQDIGSAQCAAKLIVGQGLKPHFLVMMTTRCHFHRAGWLDRLVEARGKFGIGLYGTAANRDGHRLHICSHAYSVDASVLTDYPVLIDSREAAVRMEHYDDNPLGNFTEWCEGRSVPGRIVTFDGVYEKPDWFTPLNRFRNGDQSNVLIWDRHTDIYAASSPEEKLALERAIDS